MNTKPSVRSLLAVAFLLFLSVACKEPKGREWDNAYPDEPNSLDVDGPPRVRADEKWIDRRTAPKPVPEEKPAEKPVEKSDPEATKKEGN